MDHTLDEHQDAMPEATEGATQRWVDRVSPLLLLAATVFMLDQISKALIRRWLALGERWPEDFELIRLSHVENDGAAFGILQGAGPLFIITTLVAVAVIGFTIFRPNEYPRWFTLALALVLGGAIGNLADRLARGAVTDFIDPTHYPAFNLADSAIVIGVATLLILTLFDRDEAAATDQPASEDPAA